MISNQKFREKLQNIITELKPQIDENQKLLATAQDKIVRFFSCNSEQSKKMLITFAYSPDYDYFASEIKDKFSSKKENLEDLFQELNNILKRKRDFLQLMKEEDCYQEVVSCLSGKKIPSPKFLKTLVENHKSLGEFLTNSLQENSLSAELIVLLFKNSKVEDCTAIGGLQSFFPETVPAKTEELYDKRFEEFYKIEVSRNFLFNIISKSAFKAADFEEIFSCLNLLLFAKPSLEEKKANNKTVKIDFQPTRDLLEILVHHLEMSDKCSVQLGDPFDWLCVIARGCDYGKKMHSLSQLKSRLICILNAIAELVQTRQFDAKKAQAIAIAVTSMHEVRQLHALEIELVRTARLKKISPIVHKILDKTW